VTPAELDVVVDHWQAAWQGSGDEGFAACCTPDVSYEDPLLVEPLEGVEALARHAARVREALPDLRLERSAPRLQSATHACLPWRVLGTHKGDVGSVPATGRFLIVHGVHYAELSDGLIRRARGFFDLYDAAVQLGLLPERGGLGEAALLLLRGFGLRPKS
jgi:steroid delta-isomerase-like uncharacterized protein